jgi:hypothetical protein
MLRSTLLAFCLSLIITAALAQPISGRVTDARTGQPLPFVNIGVVGKALGTVSNEQGQYGLAFQEKLAADTVRVSYLGYRPQLLTLRQLQGQPNLALTPAAVALAEVRVTKSRAWRDRTLGYAGNSETTTLHLDAKSLGAETGTVIYLKHRPTKVLQANFNVARNEVGTVTLRVNLYRLDAKGRPTNEKLLRREVILRTAANHGPISVDLTPDNLVLSEDFFLSLEWVGGASADAAALQKGLVFSAGIGYADNDIYYRSTSQASWERLSAGAVLAGMQPKLSFYITAQD